MKLKEILIGVIIGAILGIGGSFFAFQGRISKLEAMIEKGKSEEIPEVNNQLNSNSDDNILFEEDYNDNVNKWYTQKTELHNVQVSEGKLYVQCKEQKEASRTSTYTEEINLSHYPPKYSIKINCEYLSGIRKYPFGLVVANHDYSKFYEFDILVDNYGNVGKGSNIPPEKVSFLSSNVGVKPNNNKFEMEIVVKGNIFTYYLNGDVVKSAYFEGIVPHTIRPFVSVTQIIEFDNLKIERI